MGGNGKQHRWRISFHRSTSSKKHSLEKQQPPPTEFICQISNSLMSDPVIVTSGQTFERVSVQVCRDLKYSPLLIDGTRPDFSNLIPNLAIRTTIVNWCDGNGTVHPTAPDYRSVEEIVRTVMDSEISKTSETELLRGVAERPPEVNFTYTVSEVVLSPSHFYTSSSEESVVVNSASFPETPLPLATKPSCYDSSSSSSEIVSGESMTSSFSSSQNQISISPEEEEFVTKMTSTDVYEQEQSVISLRKLTRTNEKVRASLCSPRVLAALRTLIVSRYSVVQTNSMAALVNLSLEKVNKVKIVRAGMVPLLIDVLKGGLAESQEHAAGAIFSLSLDDDNKTAIGVLGGLQPLLHALRSESERTRHDSSLALYHLSLIQSNRVKLIKLGAVSTLLTLVKTNTMSSHLILVLCNLASCTEGKSAMLDANAVEILVGMLRNGDGLESESTKENVVAALYSLCHGSLRFRGLARDAGAVEVLRTVEERGSERAREKAKRMLQMMRGRNNGDDDEEEDFGDGILDSAGVTRTRFRVGYASGGKSLYGVNSTEF